MIYKLFDQAEVIRSKNSGPYELTFDIIFKDAAHFEAFVAKNVMTASIFANLYNIAEGDVQSVIAFAPAKAVKVTIIRPMSSGALGERDIYVAQQHGILTGFQYKLDL